MSSTPKGPNPEDAAGQQASAPPRPALDQTFLGVAPAKPVPTPARPAVAAPAVAAPAIAAPPVTAPPPAAATAPARNSAIVAAPMISVQGTRTAAPVLTSPQAFRANEQGAMAGVPGRAQMPPAQVGAAWQGPSAAPRAASPDETPSHGTPRELVTPAGAGAPLQPQRTLAPNAPSSPAGFSPEARAPLAPQVPPRMELGQQRTALASEYLRAAREAALAAQTGPQNRETAAGGRAGSPHETRAPGWSETSTRRDLDADPKAFHESAPSRDDFGTQASVAPPFPDQGREERAPAIQPSFAFAPPAPLPVPPPIGSKAASLPMPMAPMAVPGHLRPEPPAFARTMLEPASAPAGHEDRPSSPLFGRGSSPPSAASHFEHVPMARGSLSDQSALQIPIDQSSVWDQAGVGHDSTEKLTGHAKSSARTRLLLLSALAVLAVAAIGFVTFGDRLTGSAQRQQALLPRAPAAPAPASLPLEPPPAIDSKVSLPSGMSAKRSPVPRSEQDSAEDDAAAAAAARAAEAQASPEDKLAAEAARQVIASRYAEALPMYRELARKFPENTAYGAMTHILEQKTAAAAASNGAKANLPGATP